MDVITVQWIEHLIKCFETRKNLTFRIEPNKTKGLILLRILNEAQRRLSKIKYSHLSGWFLTFISNLFPLSERSGNFDGFRMAAIGALMRGIRAKFFP